MRFAFLLAAWPLLAQVDVNELLRKCREADERNGAIERNYVFEERTENRYVDAKGKVKSKEVETHETTFTGGRPIRKLIARNDRPLPPAEAKKEQAKLQKEIDDRARETPAQREKALEAEEEKRRKNRELARETLQAFNFRIVQEDADTWTLEGTPRPGFKPKTRETSILKHFRGRISISKHDYNWTHIDAEATDDISFGLVIARLDKGAHFVVDRTRVNDEVWLPKRISGGGAARIAVVKKLRIEFEIACSKYQRFTSDSRLVTEPVK